MDQSEIVKRVNAIFIDQFELDEATLTPDQRIFDDLGLDSLDIVDLMVGLQRQFGVSLRENEEIRRIEKLGDIYAFFEKMIRENPEMVNRIKP